MSLELFDKIGNWNPQLLREIKGRLHFINISISSGISVLVQGLILIYFYSQLPNVLAVITPINSVRSRYCFTKDLYQNWYNYDCIKDSTSYFIINWPAWWLDVFICLSIIGIFTLLLLGTWLLVQDLFYEESRGTLNFIRLSPQSTLNVLIGKLLGVPILLYLGISLMIPLHLWAGQLAGISLSSLLIFYATVIASCLFFFSAALLVGLISQCFNGFQAWLGAGFFFLLSFMGTVKWIRQNASDLLNVLFPSLTLSSLISGLFPDYRFSWIVQDSEQLKWFEQLLGKDTFSIATFTILVCGFCSYWIWQALLRCFANPGKLLLSKKQGYLLIASSEILILGFAFNDSLNGVGESYSSLLSINLCLFLGMIVALTPSRQALYDWARYRHLKISNKKRFWYFSLIHDLLWSESSPALLAIAINLVSATVILLPWAFQWEGAIVSLVLMVNWILIYATIYQLIWLIQPPKKELWLIGILGTLLILVPILLNIFSFTVSSHPFLWMLLTFPALWSWKAIQLASPSIIMIVLLCHWLILIGLSLYFTQQLKKAGESASKAFLNARYSGNNLS